LTADACAQVTAKVWSGDQSAWVPSVALRRGVGAYNKLAEMMAAAAAATTPTAVVSFLQRLGFVAADAGVAPDAVLGMHALCTLKRARAVPLLFAFSKADVGRSECACDVIFALFVNISNRSSHACTTTHIHFFLSLLHNKLWRLTSACACFM